MNINKNIICKGLDEIETVNLRAVFLFSRVRCVDFLCFSSPSVSIIAKHLFIGTKVK